MKAPPKGWLAITSEVLASRLIMIIGTSMLMFIAGLAAAPDRLVVVHATTVAAPPVVRPPAPAHSFRWPQPRIHCYFPYIEGPCR